MVNMSWFLFHFDWIRKRICEATTSVMSTYCRRAGTYRAWTIGTWVFVPKFSADALIPYSNQSGQIMLTNLVYPNYVLRASGAPAGSTKWELQISTYLLTNQKAWFCFFFVCISFWKTNGFTENKSRFFNQWYCFGRKNKQILNKKQNSETFRFSCHHPVSSSISK